MTIAKDQEAIDLYLTTHCQTSTWDNGFQEDQIAPLNTLLLKLTEYLKKYNEPFLGSIINKEKITRVDTLREELMRGKATNSHTFIKEKISYKTTKIKKLEKAIRLTDQEKITRTSDIHQDVARFFKNKKGKQPDDVLNDGLRLLKDKLAVQKNKVDGLKACLPTP